MVNIQNENEVGKTFKINCSKDNLKNILIDEDSEIIDEQGVLLYQNPDGYCMVSIKIKLKIGDREIIQDSQRLIARDQLSLIENSEPQ